jgi:hypothetical protein
MIFLLAFISGVCGRAGGAAKTGKWYDFMIRSITRDLGCSIILILACWYYFGWHTWEYLATFALTWAAFSTYWDDSKNKFIDGINRRINWMYPADNFYLSGLMVGLAAFPLCFIDPMLCWIVPLRAVFLMVSWGLTDKYMPSILIWRSDVLKEFSRYAISL